jgi:hypothetical protein
MTSRREVAAGSTVTPCGWSADSRGFPQSGHCPSCLDSRCRAYLSSGGLIFFRRSAQYPARAGSSGDAAPLLAYLYLYLAVAGAIQRQQDAGSDLDAGLMTDRREIAQASEHPNIRTSEHPNIRNKFAHKG